MPDTRRAFLALTAVGGLGAVAASRAQPAAAQPAAAQAATARPEGPRPGTSVNAADAGLVGDGVTDDAPAIQAAYDAGVGAIDFEAAKDYLLDSPVFIDRSDTYEQFVLNLDGGTLKLGPNLPTTAAFWRDETVQWAFFTNTKRSALSGGTVKADTSTRATGSSVGGLLALTVRNGTIDGDGRNAGFSFANRTGSRFEGVVLYRGRTLHSWTDYSDLNVFLQCHNRAGGPANSVLVEQISSGDGLLMASCKSDGSVGLARLKYSRGAEITGTVTGRIELDSCSAVHISSAHQEAPVSNATMLTIRNSQVTVDSSVLYLTRGKTVQPPAITIDDSATDGHTELVLTNTLEMRALSSEDVPLGALIAVAKPAESTTITARGLTAVTTAPGTGGVWIASPGVQITGSDEIVAAAAAAPAVIATGEWVLARRSGAWVVQPTSAAPGSELKRPEVLKAEGSSGDVSGGSLPVVQPLTYVVMARNAAGKSSLRSAIAPTVAGPARTVKLVVRLDSAPCELRIWRFRGTSTTVDAYLSIPCARPKVTLYDLGTYLSGYAWLPGSAGS